MFWPPRNVHPQQFWPPNIFDPSKICYPNKCSPKKFDPYNLSSALMAHALHSDQLSMLGGISAWCTNWEIVILMFSWSVCVWLGSGDLPVQGLGGSICMWQGLVGWRPVFLIIVQGIWAGVTCLCLLWGYSYVIGCFTARLFWGCWGCCRCSICQGAHWPVIPGWCKYSISVS